MAKVHLNPALQKKQYEQFESLVDSTINLVKKDKNINIFGLDNRLKKLHDIYCEAGQPEQMGKAYKRLAEVLVSLKNDNLASIIYSFLIKVNRGNEATIEQLATNGLKIAKRLNDPIHIMARAEDLRAIYQHKPSSQDKLLKVLYEQKRALSNITSNYESASKRYRTVSRQMQPIEAYEKRLSWIKQKIAEILLEQGGKHNINQAILELEEARLICAKNESLAQYIEKLDELIVKAKLMEAK